MPCDPRRLPKITGTRVDAWLWRFYGSSLIATRGGIGRLGCGPVVVRGGAALCGVRSRFWMRVRVLPRV